MIARRIFSILLIFFACLTSMVALSCYWANQQLLDQQTFTATMTRTLSQPQVVNALSDEAVNQIYSQVNVDSLVANILPNSVEGLSPWIANSLRSPLTNLTSRLLNSQPVRQAETKIISDSHRELVMVLRGQGRLLYADGDQIDLNLRQLAIDAANQVGLGSQLGQLVPVGQGRIKLIEESWVGQARLLVTWLPPLATYLPWLALLLAFGGIAIANNRASAIFGLGAGLVITAVSLILATTQVPTQLANSLSGIGLTFGLAFWQEASPQLIDAIHNLLWLAVFLLLAGLLALPQTLALRRQVALILVRPSWLYLGLGAAIILSLLILVGVTWWLALALIALLLLWRVQMQREHLPPGSDTPAWVSNLTKSRSIRARASSDQSNSSFIDWLSVGSVADDRQTDQVNTDSQGKKQKSSEDSVDQNHQNESAANDSDSEAADHLSGSDRSANKEDDRGKTGNPSKPQAKARPKRETTTTRKKSTGQSRKNTSRSTSSAAKQRSSGAKTKSESD